MSQAVPPRATFRLIAVGLTWAGVLFLVFDLTVAVPLMARSNVDFPLWYAAGLVARTHGTQHIYDLDLMRRVTAELAGHPFPNAYISPPPLAWLALPFTFLPYPVAYGAWVGALLVSLLVSWALAAASSGWSRWAALAVPAGLFPVAFSVMVGAVPAFGILLLVLSWRALRSGRPYLAGLMLSLMAIKPQLGLLVAPALLLAGHWRVFAAWCAGSSLLVGASAVALGAGGLADELRTLQSASGWAISQRFTLAALVGPAWVRPAQVAAAVASLAAARRTRSSGIELPIAAGLVGSLLFSPYLSLQDYSMLVPGAWLIWRTSPPIWVRVLVLASLVPLELALVWGPLPILLIELAWLGALLAFRSAAWPQERPTLAVVPQQRSAAAW